MGLFKQIRDAADGDGDGERDGDGHHDEKAAEPEEGEGEARGTVSRREFLGGTAAVFAGSGVAYLRGGIPLRRGGTAARTMASLAQLTSSNGEKSAAPHFTILPSFVIPVERDADMLLLEFRFFGFSLDSSSFPTTIRPDSATNYIVVRFPPQSVGEAAYLFSQPLTTADDHPSNQNGLAFDPPPILSDVSGPSQVSFTLPPDGSIPLPTMTAADLLDWSGWAMNVPAVAVSFGSGGIPSLPPALEPSAPKSSTRRARRAKDPVGSITFNSTPVPTLPAWYETWLEIPYAMFLSPTVLGSGSYITTFDNRATPLVSAAGVSDLSRSQLQVRSELSFLPDPPPQVAAVWCRDYVSYDPAHGSTAVQNVTPQQFVYYGL